MRKHKISIIGAGMVGSTTAYLAASKGLGDVVLVDIVEGIPQGKGLDISESTPVLGASVSVKGTNSYDDVKDSDIVVITAGVARKPGMSRDDLLKTNTKIVSSVSEQVKKAAPQAIVIVVSNPLDAMVYVASKVGWAKNRIMGMAGVLDSTRFASFIAEEAKVSVENVHTFVLGGHGDQMIPLTRYSNIAGVPLEQFISKAKLDNIVDRTRKGGIEIVNHLKTGSAYYAPAASICEMMEAIVKDKKKILPCAAYLDGEYGAKGVFIGVPAKLGKDGVEQVIELKLTDSEKKAFDENVKHVKSLMEEV
ncbi:malate dehydrogenase [Candidatus Woesearchaeota archaeon]|nr:malate dehydrogenase [Candidatus Woesearchaeota archaeon]